MTSGRALLETGALVALTIGAAVSLYQTLFCVWMLAHPLYASSEWKTRLGIRLATTLALGCGMLVVAIVRWRRKHRSSG